MNHPLHYMQQALKLAERGRYTVSPNPLVGCVIVKDDLVVGQGYHQKTGHAHAEIIALQGAGANAKNATLYVTLEPCCHYGRTPPCTEAIISAGIKKVVIACLDTNAKVHAMGVQALKEAGISVEVGLMQNAAQQLNEIFFHYIKTKKPFITLKWAMSLDGQTITKRNDNKQLSGEASIQHVHGLRWMHDAIMVGAETIRDDDPLLTARHLPDTPHTHLLKQPIRLVVTSKGDDISTNSQVFTNHEARTCVITGPHACADWLATLKQNKIDVIIVPEIAPHCLDINAMLIELGRMEITSVLVEGGMSLHQSFMQSNCVNKVITYVTNTLIGNMSHKKRVEIQNINQLDDDICIIANPI